jgi:hypothetical protein
MKGKLCFAFENAYACWSQAQMNNDGNRIRRVEADMVGPLMGSVERAASFSLDVRSREP